MASLSQLPIPDFYQADRVGEIWRVPYQTLVKQAQAWAQQHRLQPAAQDDVRVCLVIIDAQNTFCIPDHELFVGGRSGQGAVEDNRRLCEFIYRNLGTITTIIPTLDTHTAMQIFHPSFWVDQAGNHPAPMTMIDYDQVQQGIWKVNPDIAANLEEDIDQAALQAYGLHYTRQLSDRGKYPLTIWPYHGMLGGIGHALVSAVEEACFFHAMARSSQTRFEQKGANPLTENYSVLSPEVLTNADGQPIAQKNSALIEKLLKFDRVVIAGQAKSHCVAWTIDDLLAEIQDRDPRLAQKVYLLEDCTSPVVVPGVVDFTDQADAAFERYGQAGMHGVKSTQAIADWPSPNP